MGAPDGAWLFALHGLLAAALAVTVARKIARSLPKAVAARRWRRVRLGSILSLATVASLVAGFAWVAGGRLLTIGAWTVLTLHVWIGLVLIPLAVVHLAPRRWRLLVPRRRPASPPPRTVRVLTRRGCWPPVSLGAASLALFGVSRGRRPPDRRCPAVHGIALAAGGRRAAIDDVPRRGCPRHRSASLAAPASTAEARDTQSVPRRS